MYKSSYPKLTIKCTGCLFKTRSFWMGACSDWSLQPTKSVSQASKVFIKIKKNRPKFLPKLITKILNLLFKLAPVVDLDLGDYLGLSAYKKPPLTAIAEICDALRDLVPFVQFKNVKNTHGGVLILVKLQAEAMQWVFFTFLKLCTSH